MSFQASKNLSEQIAEYLTAKIIRCELPPGARILEANLAKELDVSRGPIREAFRVLEKRKLVDLIPRRGARVTEMSPTYIGWLYDVIGELYGLVAYKAAENRGEDDVARVFGALKIVEECAARGDAEGYYAALFEYAAACGKAAGNDLLNQLVLDLEPSVRRTQFVSLSQRARDLPNIQHFMQRAAQHVKNGEASLAADVIRAYVHSEKEFVIKICLKGI